ncbi:MAG TPA: TetR/AcrR family transcriptional regulator [Solirubrobacter sp.]|nr:TetR/AcrR family transcriptional regulator [Solirubrobacter sp.]
MSRNFQITLKILWGREKRGERGPKPGLTVERIVQAGLELADAEGLEAVSMRRVADRLGVGAMSLYRYVPGKTELLDLMLDAVYADDSVMPEGNWRTQLEWLARRSRDRMKRHAWMLQVEVGQRPPLGPNILAEFDAYLAAVSGIGLTPPETIAATDLVRFFVQGATRNEIETERAQREVSDEEYWDERQEFWEDYFEPERFPSITFAWEAGAYEDVVDSFEFGLQRILDGIEARLRR